MKFQKLICVIPFVLFFVNCTNINKNELAGTYIVRNNVNTIDTLRILNNGIYQRGLYRNKDQSLIYKNEGNWRYKNGMIELDSFYIDFDNIYKIGSGGFKESSQYCFFEVERVFWKIHIGTKINDTYLYVKL